MTKNVKEMQNIFVLKTVREGQLFPSTYYAIIPRITIDPHSSQTALEVA